VLKGEPPQSTPGSQGGGSAPSTHLPKSAGRKRGEDAAGGGNMEPQAT